jgi:hypothetical protein
MSSDLALAPPTGRSMIEELQTNHRDVRQQCRSTNARNRLSDFRELVRKQRPRHRSISPLSATLP